MNRRQFLSGVSAVATVAALPALPTPSQSSLWFDAAVAHRGVAGLSVYNGVMIREVVDLNASARAALRGWARRQSSWGEIYESPVLGEVV